MAPAKASVDANALVGRGIARLMSFPAKPSCTAYYYLGKALQTKGLKDRAAAAYRKALELKPGNPDARSGLAALN